MGLDGVRSRANEAEEYRMRPSRLEEPTAQPTARRRVSSGVPSSVLVYVESYVFAISSCIAR